jgi:hypothetical protein
MHFLLPGESSDQEDISGGNNNTAAGQGDKVNDQQATDDDEGPGLSNGNYVAVVNAPNGADGFGHNALMAGNDKTGWTLTSKEGRQEGSSKADPSNNGSTGGPALPPRVAKFSTMKDFFNDSHFKEYKRAAIFAVTQKQATMANEIMLKEAASRYSILYNNCGHAVSNTFEKIGLEGAYVRTAVPAPGGYATGLTCNPMPNVMYSDMIGNNRAKLVLQIIK